MKPEITFEDFSKIDIRVGTIIEVNDFPEIQRLFDVMNEQLEMVIAFDKSAFTENVDNLYAILAKMNGKS